MRPAGAPRSILRPTSSMRRYTAFDSASSARSRYGKARRTDGCPDRVGDERNFATGKSGSRGSRELDLGRRRRQTTIVDTVSAVFGVS